MKKIMTLLLICQPLVAMDAEYQLPSRDVLQERLNSINDHFVRHSGILALLEKHKPATAKSALVVIEIAIGDYIQFLKKDYRMYSAEETIKKYMPSHKEILSYQKHQFLEAMFKDHPNALEALKKRGYL